MNKRAFKTINREREPVRRYFPRTSTNRYKPVVAHVDFAEVEVRTVAQHIAEEDQGILSESRSNDPEELTPVEALNTVNTLRRVQSNPALAMPYGKQPQVEQSYDSVRYTVASERVTRPNLYGIGAEVMVDKIHKGKVVAIGLGVDARLTVNAPTLKRGTIIVDAKRVSSVLP